MRHLAAEFFRRSVHVTAGCVEVMAEVRPRDWPSAWGWRRDRHEAEIWAGRIYVCFARAAHVVEEEQETERETAVIIPFDFRANSATCVPDIRSDQEASFPLSEISNVPQALSKKRILAPIVLAVSLGCGLTSCTDPYDPGQRAVGGGLLGAGAGAAIGGLAGGGRGAATGALIGAGVGALGGAATTPQAPRGYYGNPYYGSPGYYAPPAYYAPPSYYRY